MQSTIVREELVLGNVSLGSLVVLIACIGGLSCVGGNGLEWDGLSTDGFNDGLGVSGLGHLNETFIAVTVPVVLSFAVEIVQVLVLGFVAVD